MSAPSLPSLLQRFFTERLITHNVHFVSCGVEYHRL
jgi:hypothetical protein